MTVKERVALVSILATVLITLAKGVAGYVTGSLALMSDAAQSLLDVAATAVTFLVVRISDRPPDEDHPYGHGKFESVAALGQTMLLCALAGVFAVEGVRRLVSSQPPVETSIAAFAVLIASIAIDAWRWRTLTKTAQATGSEALAADALHFSADLVNSLLVMAALAAVALGYPQADSLVAVGVAAFMAVTGWRLGRRTIDSLVDAAPKGVAERISEAVNRTAGVVDIDMLRVRRAGASIYGDIGIRVARSLPLERVVEIKAAVVAQIASVAPEALLTVAANPVALDDETLRERILLIAARLKLPIHHVTIQQVGDRLCISLDLEVDGAMALGAAHAQASALENAIRADFGASIEVETHIEPLEVSEWSGEDAGPGAAGGIAAALTQFAAETRSIADVHSVRVRRAEGGLVVIYHCRVDPALPVAEVHRQVDVIERRLKEETSGLMRVVGHAEPKKSSTATG